MILINKEKVVKVSAHIPGRVHGGKQIDLWPLREGRENMRQHTLLNLLCRAQLPNDLLLFSFLVLQLHLLPLHPADRIHLLPQRLAGFVDFLLHSLEFIDGSRYKFLGFQVTLPDADDPVQQRVKLRHAALHPQPVDCQPDQENRAADQDDRATDTAHHMLVAFHGHLADDCPGRGIHLHGERADRLIVFILEDRAGVALADQELRIQACFSACMIDFRLIGGKKMPAALPILQGVELVLKDALVHQHQRIALAIAYVDGFPGGNHDAPGRCFVFKAIDRRPGNGPDPNRLPQWRVKNLSFHFFRKRVFL